MEWKDRQRRLWVMMSTAAACLVLGLIVWRSPLLHVGPTVCVGNEPRALEQAEVTRELDLSNYVTTRGVGDDAVQLKAVSLPTALVHVDLILPRLSEAGSYTVAVSTDRRGSNIVAVGKAVAVGSDPRTTLGVTLDLRKAVAGLYFLSTEREADGGAYYYPLKVE
jgi:hypothetical protein